MGIWIRSQDKENLINVNKIQIADFHNMYKNAIWGDDILLGIYSNKEKALKVLDMIEKKLIENNTIICNEKEWAKYVGIRNCVFQMPQDEV